MTPERGIALTSQIPAFKARAPEKLYTAAEFEAMLYDSGFEIRSRDDKDNPSGWPWSNNLAPDIITCVLETACGATRERIGHWPPPMTIEVPVAQTRVKWPVDPKADELRVSVRRFELKERVSWARFRYEESL